MGHNHYNNSRFVNINWSRNSGSQKNKKKLVNAKTIISTYHITDFKTAKYFKLIKSYLK